MGALSAIGLIKRWGFARRIFASATGPTEASSPAQRIQRAKRMVQVAEELAGPLQGKRVVEVGCSLWPFLGIEAALRGAQVDLVERNIGCEPVVRAYFQPDPQEALRIHQRRLEREVDDKRENRHDPEGYVAAFQCWMNFLTFLTIDWPVVAASLPRSPIGLSLHFGKPFQKVKLAAAPDIIFSGQVLEVETGMGYIHSIHEKLKPGGWFVGDTTFWPDEEERFPNAFPNPASVKKALASGGFKKEQMLVLGKRWNKKGEFGAYPGQRQIQHAFFAQK